ncbi:MAG: Histidine ammonia-lyase [uncultured Sphingosinicella sp.]|uniref:Histidine ammonia-lyase n=1 Tax=uncultured Sphingosinicella sp. TaxID=478748 RepID=A0A6J4TLR3_9SPHN|nr:histidine ammonia-lyase [uncultured Sphingosinicella sp.]CAA9525267.1 MAG: Histidine ammonia-lyase [uncultured Sphingosinicella sp.]
MGVLLRPGSVSLAELRQVWAGAAVELEEPAWAAIDAAAESIGRILESGRTVYGVNTGFGLLAQTRIADDRLLDLQRNLILSHSCGLGDALDRRVVRLAIVLKAIGLGCGHSGVRRVLVERLLALLQADALPVIPAQGSVGASGDLAPLAHMSAPLIGEGQIAFRGEIMPAAAALAKLGLDPLVLTPKEGLALINGTQISTAIALDALFAGERVFASALVSGALSLDALKGSVAAFDPRIHEARGQPGQIAVAAALKRLLEGSAINQSHADCGKVQDPYSFRCQPQVMGASLDLMRHVARTLEIEANAVTDNPVVFPDSDEAVSGGNFHAQPVAFAADMLSMALCEVGSISERRLAVLLDPKMSGLPAFLVEDSGVNSGFMIAQVTAAALVSENKTLAFPSSVDSIPTSANQEDHVSMATTAAREAATIARNAAGAVAIELLAAVQGIDFHAPLLTSPQLDRIVSAVREVVPHLAADRYLADELAWGQRAVLDGTLSAGVADELF